MKMITLLASLLLSSSVYALDLQQFLQAYVKNSTNLTNQKLQFQKAQNNYSGTSLLNKLNYKFKPYYQKTDYIIPGATNYTFDSKSAESSLNYTMPSATNIEIGGSYYLSEKSNETNEQKNYSLSLMITQPLGKNGFGQMDRRLRDSYFYTQKASHIELEQTILSECANASLTYLRAYNNQEKLIIATQQDQKSKQVWKQSQQNYKRRLISKIDYLAANSDHLETQLSRINYETNYQNDLATLKKYSLHRDIGKLKNPVDTLQQITTPNIKIESSPLLKQLQFQVKSTSNYYQHIQSKTSFDITLFAGAGSQKNDVSQTTAGDSRNDYVIAGLSMDFPIINGNNNTERGNALADKLITENNLRQARLDLKEEAFIKQTRLDLIQKAIDIAREKIVLYRKQVTEAHKKMLSGKIDFKDYILYRDQYSNEQMNLLDQVYFLYETKFALAQIGGHLPLFCENNK